MQDLSRDNHSKSISVARQFKVILLGDSSVGKSSIIQRYTKDIFMDDSQSTVACDFSTKVLFLETDK